MEEEGKLHCAVYRMYFAQYSTLHSQMKINYKALLVVDPPACLKLVREP